VIGLLIDLSALGGCSHKSPGDAGGAAAAAADPPAAAGFSFVQHRLPGVWLPDAVAYQTPPYVIGTVNDGHGNLTALTLTTMGLDSIGVSPRIPYDVRVADFNGDGIPDVLSGVYSPTDVASWVYLFLGNGDGTFTQDTSFGMQYIGPDGPGLRGRTETLVAADFNNDGAVDIFVPAYTFLDSYYDQSGDPAYTRSGAPPNVNNALQSFLLLNDGTGKFVERAVEAGVSMHSTLSGISPPSTDPKGNQPEGAQAVDFNMDGLIDLYAGGHLFINQGVDDQGVPHFKDMAGTWGLTEAILRAAPPWDPSLGIPDYLLLTDEGAKFLDWNNDGKLDLLLLRWDWGSAHGPRLFEFTGTHFIERLQFVTTPTATCKTPESGVVVPFFASTRPASLDAAEGINAYDLDNSGLEDVLVTGDAFGSTIFRNTGCGFVEVSAGDLSGEPSSDGGMALADLDNDGSIDVFYTDNDGLAYYMNTTPQMGHSFTVEVLGANGEHNQFGRVIQVFPPGTSQIYTRVVDGGSGYLTQNQYPILVGTPFSGPHTVKVYYAPLTKCVYGGPPCQPAILTFAISPGQRASTYAPSVAHPTGTVVITAAN
jgi:hypothetical protein